MHNQISPYFDQVYLDVNKFSFPLSDGNGISCKKQILFKKINKPELEFSKFKFFSVKFP